MRPGSLLSRFNVFDEMSPDDAQALLAGASGMSARDPRILRNRHVVIVCEEAANEAAHALADAARALGATVVRLTPSTLRLDEQSGLRETARLLGRLYHLIACEGLGVSANDGLCRWSGVPVLCDVGGASHVARVLADLLVMQEHSGRPAAQITLGLADDAGSETFQAWRQASALTGLRLVHLETSEPLPSAAPGQSCDYILGPAAPSGRPGSPLRAASAGADGGRENLAQRQRDAHRRLLRSVLINATG